jgi:glycerol-3-phosphate acyltransferase PlsY
LYVFLAMAVIAILVVWRHRANIGRILSNTERKITWM